MDYMKRPCLHARRGLLHLEILPEIGTNLTDFFNKFVSYLDYQIIPNDRETSRNNKLFSARGEITNNMMTSKSSGKTKLVY